jgi:hypothetical protein
MGKKMGGYRVLVGKPQGKRPLARLRHRWENNAQMEKNERTRPGFTWLRTVTSDRLLCIW